MQPTDVLLLERWQANHDADAFSELVRRHWALVAGCCSRVLGDSYLAEDVAQECFIELMQTRERVRLSLGAWLHTISVRRSIDKIKSDSRRRAREQTFAEHSAAAASDEHALNEVIAKVDEAIEQLPKDTRLILMARFFDGQTHAEIGSTLGITESAVRYRLNDAIEQVRRKLKRIGVVATVATVTASLDTPAASVPAPVLLRLAKLAMSAPSLAGGFLSLFVGAAGKIMATTAAVALAGAAVWVGLGIKGDKTQGAGHDRRPAVQSVQPNVAATQPAEAESGAVQQQSQIPENVAGTPSEDDWSISGRIYDTTTGEGIEGIEVQVNSEDSDSETVAKSGTDGAYHVKRVPDGNYMLQVLVPDEYPAWPYPTANVTLQNGAPLTGIDFPLTKGVVLAGTVVDTKGAPVGGADVVAKAVTEPNARDCKSNNDGRFALYMLPNSGDITVQARTDSFLSSAVAANIARNPDDQSLTITLDQPRTASVTGAVVDAAGAAVINATVRLYQPVTNLFLDEKHCQTNEKGEFSLDGCAPGDYAVLVTPDGVRAFGASDEYAHLKLETGQHVEGLRVVYGEKGGFAIAGRVVAANGSPIENAQVRCFARGFVSAYSDSTGAFTLTGLDDREYGLDVQHKDYSVVHPKLKAGTLDAVIVLKQRCTVAGRVVRADTGEPVAAFTLTSVGGKTDELDWMIYTNGKAINNAEGTFKLENVSEGNCTVAAWAKGFAPQVQHPILKGGSVTALEFRLNPVKPVNGVVVDNSGAPVPDALVYFAEHAIGYRELREIAATTSGADGRFILESLSPKAKKVYAYHPGFGIAGAAPADDITIVLPPSATLAGAVDNEAALKAISVYASYPDEPAFPGAQSTIDSSGAFRITGLSPGALLVNISFSQSRSLAVEQTVEVTPGATISLDFPNPAGTVSFAGRATKGGEPLTEGRVELKKIAGDATFVARAQLSQDGSFKFDQVWPGPAELVITAYEPYKDNSFEVELPETPTPPQEFQLTD